VNGVLALTETGKDKVRLPGHPQCDGGWGPQQWEAAMMRVHDTGNGGWGPQSRKQP